MNTDKKLLQHIHKNAAMGVNTIPQVLSMPKPRHVSISERPAAGIPLHRRSSAALRPTARQSAEGPGHRRSCHVQGYASGPYHRRPQHFPSGGIDDSRQYHGYRPDDAPPASIVRRGRPGACGAGTAAIMCGGTKHPRDEAFFVSIKRTRL